MTVKRSNVAKWLFKTDLVDNFKRKITGGFWNSDPSYPYKPHAGVDYGADLNEVLVAYGFIVYYQQLPIQQAVMIYFIMIFGAQGFYTVILDKDKPTHEQTYNKLNEGE